MLHPPIARRLTRLMVAALVACLTSAAPGQLRIVNYNVASLNGDWNALEDVFAALADDDKTGFAMAPHVYLFQEVKDSDIGPLTTRVANGAPAGISYTRATFTSTIDEGGGGAQAMFYRSDTFTELVGDHADIFTGASRNADRWHLELIGYNSEDASIWIYGMHLKASTGGSNEAQRFEGAEDIRNDADALPAGSNIIYAGDLNLYSNTEPAYFEFRSAGPGQAFDPLGTGSWGGSGNAVKHSQSPINSQVPGLVGGGMDDRFDFQLISAELFDGQGLAYIPGTYRVLGNDGSHYNTAINNGNNFYYPSQVARSNLLADDLHDASDHLPIVVEYKVPARIGLAMDSSFDRAIQNSVVLVDLAISNIANAVSPTATDTLVYTTISAGALSGSSSGTVPFGAAPDVSSYQLDTSLVGFRSGLVQVTGTSEGSGISSAGTSGTIVRASSPSFSNGVVETSTTVNWDVDANTGVQTIIVPVYNDGWTSLQASLDIDSVDALTAPFGFVSGLASGITSGSASLEFSFDTDGASGLQELTFDISTSDENITGETVTPITLTLSVDVTGDSVPGDVDGDGDVDFTDLVQLLAEWGDCPDLPAPCPADLNGNGTVEFTDLVLLLGNWS